MTEVARVPVKKEGDVHYFKGSSNKEYDSGSQRSSRGSSNKYNSIDRTALRYT